MIDYALYLNEEAERSENEETLTIYLTRQDLLTILTAFELTHFIIPDSIERQTAFLNKVNVEIENQLEGEWK